MMGLYAAHSASIGLKKRNFWERARERSAWLTRYSRIALNVLGLNVLDNRSQSLLIPEGAFFVGNHLSYLDVLVLASLRPTSFVTSEEVREMPVLGQLCELSSCLFVERRNKFNLHQEVRQLTEGLKHGLNITVFPEATSTNGESVLRFRRPLFRAAIDSGRPVVPFALNYRHIDGTPVTIDNRDLVCWYDDMAFVPHLWKLGGRKQITVDLTWLDPIETHSGMELEELTERAYRAVAQAYAPIKKGEVVSPHLFDEPGPLPQGAKTASNVFPS